MPCADIVSLELLEARCTIGIYKQIIFPRIIEKVMSQKEMTEIRKDLLRDCQGKVLEIGFGTGKNLSYYPDSIDELIAIDNNPGMQKFTEKRQLHTPFPLKLMIHSGEQLPFDSGSFDSVVSTWVLCSIAAVEQAVAEIYRVLKPGGKFLFVEHGLSCDAKVQRWQQRLTPIQKKIGDGCHLDRDIPAIIKTQPFRSVNVDEFYLPRTIRVGAYTYQGIAEK